VGKDGEWDQDYAATANFICTAGENIFINGSAPSTRGSTSLIYSSSDNGNTGLVLGIRLIIPSSLHIIPNVAKITYHRVGCAHQTPLIPSVKGGQSPPYINNSAVNWR